MMRDALSLAGPAPDCIIMKSRVAPLDIDSEAKPVPSLPHTRQTVLKRRRSSLAERFVSDYGRKRKHSTERLFIRARSEWTQAKSKLCQEIMIEAGADEGCLNQADVCHASAGILCGTWRHSIMWVIALMLISCFASRW